MPTSRLIKEGSKDQQFGHAPMLRRTRNGWEGEMEFLVDTMNEYEAIVASGVPAIGQPYSNDLVAPIPSCLCVEQEYLYISGHDAPDGSGALGKVRNRYAEIGIEVLPPPTQSTKYTLLNLQTENITVFFDRRWQSGGEFAEPIANGDGYARPLGTITARIVLYLPLSSWPDMSRLLRLARQKKLNSDPITLPPIVGTSVTLNLGPGQARYEGFEHDVKGGLIEFRHEITLAEDFIFRWQKEDEQGVAFASVETEIFEAEPFAGLW